MSLLNTIFGDANERYLKSLAGIVEKINELEKDLTPLSQKELGEKTEELKNKIKEGTELDEVLPMAFALTREAAKRTLNQRHFDVQLLGAIVLHQGQIAEMRTGEGKTLTATPAVFLNALCGQGVHVITVNDYLAKRDSVWMGQIYNYLGLSVGCLQHESSFLYHEAAKTSDAERDLGIKASDQFLKPVARAEAYAADITYGTNNEFGFDYLRDNMVPDVGQMVQRPLNFAIVDEVDSILIDEARTPLIISAPAEESTEKYYQFAKLVRILKANDDYKIDEKMRAATLTEAGIEKIEKALGVDNIYQTHGIITVHHLEEALRAETLFKLDRDYVVSAKGGSASGGKEDEVIIVDEFTGRLMFGRRYSGGLHQAIEAKEGVKIQRESITLATVTFQNYFRMYKKLSGMTGTAATESEEFSKIYNLDVTIIPTNKPMVRKDLNDRIYKSEIGKFKAVVQEVKKRHDLGQPILIGTISIEKNEILSELLSREGIKHEVLNAKNHAREAEIIAQAGKLKAVTLATNMAGRGVDIILGGHPADPEETEKVVTAGGLYVLGTERHESRRIDNQLRGRGGRQGDPGASQFYVSLEDDLMRIFGSDRMKSLMTTLGVPEDMPIENKLISKSIESAQKRVEGNNFDIRKHLVEYDDVLNKQRGVIYKKRREILESNNTKETILEMLDKEIAQIINSISDDSEKVLENLETVISFSKEDKEQIKEKLTSDINQATIFTQQIIKEKYELMEKQIAETLTTPEITSPLRQLEKFLLLRTIDSLWLEHLEAIEYLRTGIGLRGYGQRDPLIEYKRESFTMFQQLLDEIQNQVTHNVFKIGLSAHLALPANENQRPAIELKQDVSPFAKETQGRGEIKKAVTGKPRDAEGQKVGRNDPCPCGAKKENGESIKFKHCHGK